MKGVNLMSDFEKQVRIALIQQEKTLTNLATEMGISVSYLYELLKGTRTAEDQKQKIKNLLGLDIVSDEQTDDQ
jgi:transcriptional regulator with XRE-family HTH domain